MRRLDRGTLRAAGFVALLTVVFTVVNTTVAAAADGHDDQGGGLLAPLNITTSEGAPLDRYELDADGGSVTNVGDQVRTLILGGIFTLVRLMVGLACWLIKVSFGFPLSKALIRPAQKIADDYSHIVVDTLGLKGVLLSWAFVFGLIGFVRGKVAQGLGEIAMTLLIAAFAASVFVRPDYLLGPNGPLEQTHQAALEVAQDTVNSHFHHGVADDPCTVAVGPVQHACEDSGAHAAAVAKPLQDVLTDVLVVKPYQLLEYGRILDPKKPADKQAYAEHLRWVTGRTTKEEEKRKKGCDHLIGQLKQYCLTGQKPPSPVHLIEHPLSALDAPQSESQSNFDTFLEQLGKDGKTGKAAAAYAKDPTWDRVGGALLLLVAVVLITALVIAMALVLLGTQAADVGASAVGGVALVWGMLPGPSRMVVWRWLSVFLASVMIMFIAAMLLPAFGVAVDAVLTNGPHLMVDRLLLVDAMALAALVFHRRLTASAHTFGERLAMRMRYSRIGGTHLPGDTSEVGAALAMNGVGAGAGMLAVGGGSGARAALSDGTGMPIDVGQLLGQGLTEARRGLAPFAIAGRLGHEALIGQRPDDTKLAKLRKATTASHAGGPQKASNSKKNSQKNKQALPGTQVHNRLVRYRGYRVARQAGKLGYHSTVGLPAAISRGRGRSSRAAQDVRAQLHAYANRWRSDVEQWTAAGRAINTAGQRAAVAAQVHGPAAAAAVQRGVRNAVTGAWPRKTTSAPATPRQQTRQRILEALRVRRSAGQSGPPPGDGDGDQS